MSGGDFHIPLFLFVALAIGVLYLERKIWEWVQRWLQERERRRRQ